MPVLLAGVLGAPSKHEQLAEYLKKLLGQTTSPESRRSDSDKVDAARFLWFVLVNNCVSYLIYRLYIIQHVVSFLQHIRRASQHDFQYTVGNGC